MYENLKVLIRSAEQASHVDGCVASAAELADLEVAREMCRLLTREWGGLDSIYTPESVQCLMAEAKAEELLKVLQELLLV